MFAELQFVVFVVPEVGLNDARSVLSKAVDFQVSFSVIGTTN